MRTMEARKRLRVTTGIKAAVVACALTACTGNPPDVGSQSIRTQHPTWATTDHLIGAIDAAEPMQLRVHLAMHNADQAEAELAAISDPDDPRYGQFLSDDEFNARYAPTADDVDAVRRHLEGFGLTVNEIPDNRAYIAVGGAAGDVQRAFSTTIATYRDGSTIKHAPITDVTLPAAIASRVLTVSGIATPASFAPRAHVDLIRTDTYRPANAAQGCSDYYGQVRDTSDPPYPGYSPLTAAPCGYVPAQLRAAYGFDAAVRSGVDGRSQSIAIIDVYTPPTLLADVQQYVHNHDATHPLSQSQLVQLVGPGSPSPVDTGWYEESSLDVEAVHAIAPGAQIVYVGAQSSNDDDIIAAMNVVVSKHLATVISNSYGDLEYGSDALFARRGVRSRSRPVSRGSGCTSRQAISVTKGR